MTKSEYAKYLQSAHWRERREKAIALSDGVCNECLIPRWLAEVAYEQDLHVHHYSYANLGNEEDEDLGVLCRRCHETETFGRSELKAPKASKCGVCDSTHFDYREEWCDSCRRIFDTPYLWWIAMLDDPTGDHACIADYLIFQMANRKRSERVKVPF